MATFDARAQPGLDHALRQHRLIDHQLADEIDQTVDAVEIDADGGVGGRRAARAASALADLGSRRGLSLAVSCGMLICGRALGGSRLLFRLARRRIL